MERTHMSKLNRHIAEVSIGPKRLDWRCSDEGCEG